MMEFDRPWSYEEEDEGCTAADFESLITITKAYEIFPHDLDKRVSAMVGLLSNPKANIRYNRNQAIALSNLCKSKGREDLKIIIQEALI